jgi:hypothetical protein
VIANDRDLLIQGISQRLMQAYANELMALMIGWYEGSRFYNSMRLELRRQLNERREESASGL